MPERPPWASDPAGPPWGEAASGTSPWGDTPSTPSWDQSTSGPPPGSGYPPPPGQPGPGGPHDPGVPQEPGGPQAPGGPQGPVGPTPPAGGPPLGPAPGGPYQGGPQQGGPYQGGPQQGPPQQGGPYQGGPPQQGGPPPGGPYAGPGGPQPGGPGGPTPPPGGPYSPTPYGAPNPYGPGGGSFGPGDSFDGEEESAKPWPLIAIITAVVVIGLGVGGYFLYTSMSSSDDPESSNVATEGKSEEKEAGRDRPTSKATPKPAAEKPLWTQRLPEGAPDNDLTRVIGTWVTDAVVVRGQHDSVVAYKLEDGKVAWELPKEGVGFCAMSTKTREGVGYVTYGQLTGAEDIRCNRIQAVDLATGKSRWTAEIVKDSEEYPPTETDAKRPEIFGDAVVAYAGRRSFKAFDAAGGSPKWTFDGVANNPVKADSEGECTAQDWSGSQESLYVVAACAPERFAFGKEQTVVFALDPANGKPRWATPVPAEIVPAGETRRVRLVGGEYPVIDTAATIGASRKGGINAFVPLDPASGKLGAQALKPEDISITADDSPVLSHDRLAPGTYSDGQFLVAKVKLKEALRADNRFCVQAHAVQVFDLTQGKALFEKPVAPSCELSLLGFDGKDVLAVNGGGPGEQGGSLLRIDRASGKVTPTKPLPLLEGPKYIPSGPAFLQGDKLVVVNTRPSTDTNPYSLVVARAE